MAERSLTDADLVALADVLDRRHVVPRLLSTAKVAEMLDLSEDWVRSHAAELGGIRVGDGVRGELRFELAKVNRALERRRVKREEPVAKVRRMPGPRRKPQGGDFELLELPAWAA